MVDLTLNHINHIKTDNRLDRFKDRRRYKELTRDPRLDDVIKSPHNSIVELRKEFKGKDKTITELEEQLLNK